MTLTQHIKLFSVFWNTAVDLSHKDNNVDNAMFREVRYSNHHVHIFPLTLCTLAATAAATV